MWLLPSRGRPHLAARLFSHGISHPGVLILDEDDAGSYGGVEIPTGWVKLVLERKWLSEKLNAGYEAYPDEGWYGVLNDDHVPVTEGWEGRLIEELGRQAIVWPEDNYADRISTAVMRGDLVRSLGWVACPRLRHFYLDDVHELIADCLGCRRLDGVVVSHEHVNAGRMPVDRTYRERPDNRRDHIEFLRWCKEDWPDIRRKIESL